MRIVIALLALSTTELPKVVLAGDSIRLGYAPTVTKELAGRAEVDSSNANGQHSAHVLKHPFPTP